MQFLKAIKARIVEAHDFIKALEEIPQRNFQGEFYEEKKTHQKTARRQTKTRVEDLRPPKPE